MWKLVCGFEDNMKTVGTDMWEAYSDFLKNKIKRVINKVILDGLRDL